MPEPQEEDNKKRLYPRKYIYDKYLFSVEKFDKYFSYISTGSIPLLLLFAKELFCIKYLLILILSLILYFIVVIINLIIWAISMSIFEKWVDEYDSKKSDISINNLGDLTHYLTITNIIIFILATSFAGFFVISNIINQQKFIFY